MGTRRTTATVLALALALPALAAAPPDPAFLVAEAANYANAYGRSVDQQAHPEFQQRLAGRAAIAAQQQRMEPLLVDPYLLDWGGERGTRVPASWHNRYGARIDAHLWLPPGDGIHPAVVLVNGCCAAGEERYWAMAQGLAEHGYVVLTMDLQGQGDSDVEPSRAPVDFCDPAGSWREPQEMGLREEGPCAGMPPAEDGGPGDLIELMLWRGETFDPAPGPWMRRIPMYALGAIDATDWLLSDANPFRSRVDEHRLGIVGHSAGAYAAALVANGEPKRRFRAAVAWDSHGLLPEHVAPRVPTLFQHADAEDTRPAIEPSSFLLPGHREATRFSQARVDSGLVVLGGSTHQEWNFVPYLPVTALGACPCFQASREGERVALYYTVAWLDRYLGRGRSGRPSADGRLFAATYDGSVDAFSIGQGRWDPVEVRNVPYTIAGHRASDRLSHLYRSWLDVQGRTCTDLRRGCQSAGSRLPR